MEIGAVTHEYDDPFSEETIQAAVVRVLELIRTEPGQPLDEQVEMAVHQHFCSCAVDIADEIEHRRSGIHETIANEVRKRVQTRLKTGNRVDEASEESFPASDPPSWIWERHSR